MNIIQIRDSMHREMYFAVDGWNHNRRVAREFNTPLNAIAFVIQQQIDHAELVIHRLGAGLEEITVAMEMDRAKHGSKREPEHRDQYEQAKQHTLPEPPYSSAEGNYVRRMESFAH